MFSSVRFNRTALVSALTLALALPLAAFAHQEDTTLKQDVSQATDAVVDQASDAAITAKIKTALMADERTKAFDVNVETDRHVVTLNGTAPSLASKRAAAEIARRTHGVRHVVNHLMVTSDRTDNPKTLSAKAQAAMKDDGH